MPKLEVTKGKLDYVSPAGIAAAHAMNVDPYVSREFSIDTAEVTNTAALQAIQASQQPPQPVVATTVPTVGVAQVGGEDVVVASAVLIQLSKKIDQVLKKRGLDSDDSHSDEEGAAEQCKKRKCKCEHTQGTAKTSKAKKQKTLQDATIELAGGVPGAAVVGTGAVATVDQVIGTQPILTQILAKLDKLAGESSEDEDEEEVESGDEKVDEE